MEEAKEKYRVFRVSLFFFLDLFFLFFVSLAALRVCHSGNGVFLVGVCSSGEREKGRERERVGGIWHWVAGWGKKKNLSVLRGVGG